MTLKRTRLAHVITLLYTVYSYSCVSMDSLYVYTHVLHPHHTCTALIGDLMQQLDVFISVKPKAKQQTIQSVIIKSIEQNMQCVFQVRLCNLVAAVLMGTRE